MMKTQIHVKHKQIAFVMASIALFFSAPAHAVWVKDGAVLCITKRTARAYTQQKQAKNEALTQNLLDRAACYQKKGTIKAALLSKSGNYVEMQLVSGHKVWGEKSTYKAEKTQKSTQKIVKKAKKIKKRVKPAAAKLKIAKKIPEIQPKTEETWLTKVKTYFKKTDKK